MSRKPHERAKAEKNIGRAAISGDPWAARIRKTIFDAYHPWQRAAAEDPARLWTLIVGRGGGKTTLFKGRYLVEMAETTEGRFIYACPTLGMAIKLLWNPLKAACTQLGIEPGVDATWLEAPREGGKKLIFNRTGSELVLFGADDKKQINLCRGQPFHGVGCDEVGFWQSPEIVREFVEEVIEPRIGELDGWIGLASSPGKVPRGYFYDITRDGSPRHRPYSKRVEFDEERRRTDPGYQGWEDFSSHSWSLAEVTGIVHEGDRPSRYVTEHYRPLVALRRSHLKKKRAKGWSDDNPIWMREYMGRWAADNTTTVYRFDAAKNLWKPQGDRTIDGLLMLKAAIAALPKGMEWHFVIAADKGNPRVTKKDEDGDDTERVGDPYAVNVFAFSPADPEHRIFHVYFLEQTGLYARRIAQLLLGEDKDGPNGCKPHDKPGGLFGIIGWPDGMVFDADQATIEELSNVYGLRFEKPDKRPDYKFGSVELTNSELVESRIKIIEDSPLHRQITGLQWAEQTSGALKEDPSQPNHCLVAGTLVETARGPVPIESVVVGDFVHTRNGPRRVTFSGLTGHRKVVRVDFSNGSTLVGTPDHRVWTQYGWVGLASLTGMHTAVTWESTDPVLSSCSAERSTGAIRRPPMHQCAGTTPLQMENSSIERSGRHCEGQSHQGITSTTRTETTPTTASRISSLSSGCCISASTANSPSEQPCHVRTSSSSRCPPQSHGTAHPKGRLGTRTTRETPSESRSTSESARSATSGSFPRIAVGECAARRVWPKRIAFEPGRSDVYDLTVEDEHEFFANGVLVHNSTDCLLYGREVIAALFETGVVNREDTPGKRRDEDDYPGLPESADPGDLLQSDDFEAFYERY